MAAADEPLLDHETVATPQATVQEAYRLIGFEPRAEPQWDRFRALFDPRAVLALRVFPGDEAVTVMDLDEYMVYQIREGMKEEGYSETTLHEQSFVFGDIAEARVVFEIRYGDAPPVPAIDILTLVRRAGRWWIISITSDTPGTGTPVPAEFLA